MHNNHIAPLLHLALLWGAEVPQISQKQPEDGYLFFRNTIHCYPALMAPTHLSTITTNITA